MSKIFDEMREIAKEENAKSVTNKTLLRFAITGLVDVNDRLELLLQRNEARDDEIEKINDGLEKLQSTVSGNANEMIVIKESINRTDASITETRNSVNALSTNWALVVGNYLKKHPRIGFIIAFLIGLTIMHVFGSLSGIIKAIEDLIKLTGLIT